MEREGTPEADPPADPPSVPVALQESVLKGSTLTNLSLEPVASRWPQGLQARQ